MKKSKWICASAIMFCLLLFIAPGCGGDGEDEPDGDQDSVAGPIEGELVLSDDVLQYEVPHVLDIGGETTILYRNSGGIHARKMGLGQDINIDLKGLANAAYGVTQYAVDDAYLIWNVNSAQSYRYQWALNSTQEASTGLLAPGFCVRTNQFSDMVMSAVQPGGYLYNIRLSKFTDTNELGRITMLDPDNGSNPVKTKSFACEGNIGLIGSEDGRLLSVDLNDSTPTLEILLRDNYFQLLQLDPPYVVWVDANNDIQMYNLETKQGPQMIADVDPAGRGAASVVDMRIFGSIVVWSDNSEGNYNLWATDIEKMTDPAVYPQVTKNTTDERFPYLYNGEIYWQDNRSSNWEIWKGELPPFE